MATGVSAAGGSAGGAELGVLSPHICWWVLVEGN